MFINVEFIGILFGFFIYCVWLVLEVQEVVRCSFYLEGIWCIKNNSGYNVSLGSEVYKGSINFSLGRFFRGGIS